MLRPFAECLERLMFSCGFDNEKVAGSAYEDNDEDVDEGGCWLRSCYKLRDDVSALLLRNYLLLRR